MNKVLVGGISPEGEHILQMYLDRFMPDTQIEPLRSVGIKGRMRNYATRPDVLLVILDESLYQVCAGTLDSVLNLPKVHKYQTDDGLTQFLVSKFGPLEGVSNLGVVPPDQLMQQQGDLYKDARESTIPPDMITTVSAEEDSMLVTGGSSDSDMEAELESLRNRLAQSEMLVRNLELQLNEKGSDSESDIAIFTGRIRELEAQLRDAQAASSIDEETQLKIRRADEMLSEYEELKKKLKAAKDSNASMQFERNKLEAQVKDLTAKLDESAKAVETAQDNGELEAQIEEKTREITSLRVKVSELEDDLQSKTSSLTQLSSEMQVLRDDLSKSGVDEAVINSLRDELSQKTEEAKDLQVDLESREESLSRANATIAELNEEINSLRSESGLKGQELYTSKTRLTELEDELSGLNARIEDLTKSIEDKDAELNEYCKRESQLRDEIRSLREDSDLLGRRDTEIRTLKESLAEQETLVANLSENLRDARQQSSDLSAQLTEATSRADSSAEESEANKRAYDRILQQKKQADDRIVELEGSITGLKEKVLELEDTIRERKESFDKLSDEKIEADAEIRKLNSRITTLQTDIVVSKTSEEQVARLEKELLEERRKSSRLSAEVEVLKKSEDSSSSADLRLEIARLQNELDAAKSNIEGKANIEIGSLKTELIDVRKRCADLELDLADRDEQVKEITSGVFGRMANIAIPRAVYDVALPPLTGEYGKFVCVAGGSSESNQSLYAQIRKACEKNNSLRIVVFDLTIDSCVDREFGVVKISSPISWLSGGEPFQKFVAGTKFANVKVVSTALAYLNNLFLLNVDWQKRLSEIGDFADVYILNIGCLNNITTKVLFNTFSQVMKTYVIVKATPINLRTAILNLTGVKNMSSNVTTVCVNFDDKASRDMYQRLAQKFKAQILRDTEVLALQ